MSASLPSDEVAEDYKNSLEDLVSNDRYQISNLTLIARENLEHAEAISRVLQNHIQRTPPGRKLPALYVLDSVVKNVGSPYTVYFGRNLYQTFMHAYSQVDVMVRRKLEEMLKTWREPVPGSLSTTPVFPIASTQAIVDNLSKLRTSTTISTTRNQQTPTSVNRFVATQTYRQTPTPPQSASPFPSTSQMPSQIPTLYNQQQYLPPTFPQYNEAYPQPPGEPHQLLPQPAPQPSATSLHSATSFHVGPSQPGSGQFGTVDVQKLHTDIDDLTTDAKIECATHPMDAGAQRKLTTLQTLKEILDNGTATEGDLIDIRNSIMQEMAKKMAASRQATSQQVVQRPPPVHSSYPLPQASIQPPQPSNTPSFINSTNLAELLRATATRTHTPPQPFATPYLQPTPGNGTPSAGHVTPNTTQIGGLPFLAQLRASGLLSAVPTPVHGFQQSALSTEVENQEVAFASTSIKVAHPQMVASFLNAKPNQCSTCGRRFTSEEAGREKKTKHLDWHFKTKARMIEAEQRGQNRSWYVDEREWISSKEYDDDADDGALVSGSQEMSTSTIASRKKAQDFVRAPVDPVLRSLPCPIDQEPFKSEWSEDVQDFIWKDAVLVGGRYYHASCYKEITRIREKDAGNSTPLGAGVRTATPDSILGKRKAEALVNGVQTKLKIER